MICLELQAGCDGAGSDDAVISILTSGIMQVQDAENLVFVGSFRLGKGDGDRAGGLHFIIVVINQFDVAYHQVFGERCRYLVA